MLSSGPSSIDNHKLPRTPEVWSHVSDLALHVYLTFRLVWVSPEWGSRHGAQQRLFFVTLSLTCPCNKKHTHTNTETHTHWLPQAMMNNIISLKHRETWVFPQPLSPSLSQPVRMEQRWMLFSSSLVLLCVCSTVLAELTGPLHLLILTFFFSWSLPTRLYVTSSPVTVFKGYLKFNVAGYCSHLYVLIKNDFPVVHTGHIQYRWCPHC